MVDECKEALYFEDCHVGVCHDGIVQDCLLLAYHLWRCKTERFKDWVRDRILPLTKCRSVKRAEEADADVPALTS
jgi:hypothetical protein